MNIDQFQSTLNNWGRERVPFLFLIDFEMEKPLVWKIDEVKSEEILFYVNGFSNCHLLVDKKIQTQLQKFPTSLKNYKTQFDQVMNSLSYGDSFLTNLTIKTRIQIDCTLEDLFHRSAARYKLWMKDSFLFFSPEIFIQIRDKRISSFPMKGTINADIPDAEQKILTDEKELSEHVTMVDLVRNDLSQVATKVRVKHFRYIDEIKTTETNLLQVSSEVVGDLDEDYLSRLGDIIVTLLPAASISGAPKRRTIEIIKKSEKENRGYYTGVIGYFDGLNLDSGVMIRFIEQQDQHLYYRSGGGITTQSILQSEYQEAISKIYVPVD